MNWQTWFEKEMYVLVPLLFCMAFMLVSIVVNLIRASRRMTAIDNNTVREIGWNEAKEMIAAHLGVSPDQVWLSNERGFRIMKEGFE